MLRHFRGIACALLAAMAIATTLAGCGIKGPLTPAPPPEAAKDSGNDAATRKP